MMGRIAGLCVACLIAGCALYISRFWPFELWTRDGLFGVEALRPQGDLLRRWLRGTPFAPYDLLIWAASKFVLLGILQRLWDALHRQ